VSHDGQFKSIPKDESVFDIGLERAVALLKEPKQFGARGALKVLGKHPATASRSRSTRAATAVREARQGERTLPDKDAIDTITSRSGGDPRREVEEGRRSRSRG
jgi:DNA topoisomerase-1